MASLTGSGRLLIVALALGFVTSLTIVRADQPKTASVDDVRKLQEAYQTERRQTDETGVAGRFPPQTLQRAEGVARQGDAALAAGLLDEATQAFREARWLLPSLPSDFPEHVGRVLGNARLRHGGAVDALSYSPDGQRLATAGRDRVVRVWDLANGREVITFRGHPAPASRPPAAKTSSFGTPARAKCCKPCRAIPPM